MSTPCAVVGHVRELWRFPVKSMRGERLERAEVAAAGLVGDRAWALLDAATGKPVSAKHTNEFPGLMDFGASYTEPPQAGGAIPEVVITLPDGSNASSEAGQAEKALADWFGREVRLVRHEAESSFLDAYPLSLVTTSTLSTLGQLAPDSRFDPRRFRMNLVLETGAPGFVENGWIERRLGLGETTWLTVTEPDARCVMTTLAQGDLPEDPGILRALMRHNRLEVGAAVPQPCAGVYASVMAAGSVAVGDRVLLD